MEVRHDVSLVLSKIDKRLKLAIFLTPFMHFYLPFVGEIVVLVFELSIIGLIYNIKNNDYHTSFNPFYMLFFLCLASITASNALLINRLDWSAETAISLFRYVILISHFMFALSLVKYFRLNENLAFDHLPYSILIAVILLFIDITFNLTGIDYNEGLRIITSSNIRHLGHIVIVSTLYLSIKILVTDKSNNSLFMMLAITSISLLIWLGGRGATLSYAIGLAVALIIIYKNNQLETKRTLKLASLIILSVIMSLPFNIYSWNGLNRLIETESYYTDDVNKLSSNRINLWNESWEYIKEKPILGYGSESFLLNSESEFRHPHNFIFQWLFDFGFLGTLFFLTLIICIIITGYKNQGSPLDTNRLIAITCFVALISNALISGTLYYSPPFFIICIAIAFIIKDTAYIRSKE